MRIVSAGFGMGVRSFLGMGLGMSLGFGKGSGFRFHRNVRLQRIKPHLPELAILFEPGIGAPQSMRPQPANPLPALDLTLDQSSPLQHHHVLRNRIERHVERLGDFADGRSPPRQPLHNGAPSGVSDRRKDVAQMFLRTFNHMVERCNLYVGWLSNDLFGSLGSAGMMQNPALESETCASIDGS